MLPSFDLQEGMDLGVAFDIREEMELRDMYGGQEKRWKKMKRGMIKGWREWRLEKDERNDRKLRLGVEEFGSMGVIPLFIYYG